MHLSIQLQCICHLKQCAVSSPSISKTLANPLMWNKTYWKCNKALTAKQLNLLPFPSNFSFHTFKSRTCSGIKGSQSRSSGFSLPPVRHLAPRPPSTSCSARRHRSLFISIAALTCRIIHERRMPLIDKSPCVTSLFNINKHSDPHLQQPPLQVRALHQKVLRFPGDSCLPTPNHQPPTPPHRETGGRWLMRGDKATL